MTRLYPRSFLELDPDGTVRLVTDPAPHLDLESRTLGHVEGCEFRVPDHLRDEWLRLREAYRDGQEAARAYEGETVYYGS